MLIWLLVSEPGFVGSGQKIPQKNNFRSIWCQEEKQQVDEVIEIEIVLGIRMAGNDFIRD